jgi:hypothetical protein
MSDPFGNAICIGLNGARCGKVYFWEHENEWDQMEESADNLFMLANSFTKFVARLAPSEDD